MIGINIKYKIISRLDMMMHVFNIFIGLHAFVQNLRLLFSEWRYFLDPNFILHRRLNPYSEIDPDPKFNNWRKKKLKIWLPYY